MPRAKSNMDKASNKNQGKRLVKVRDKNLSKSRDKNLTTNTGQAIHQNKQLMKIFDKQLVKIPDNDQDPSPFNKRIVQHEIRQRIINQEFEKETGKKVESLPKRKFPGLNKMVAVEIKNRKVQEEIVSNIQVSCSKEVQIDLKYSDSSNRWVF